MKMLLQSMGLRSRRACRNLDEEATPALRPALVRSGWPPLSTAPPVQWRSTDARPWSPKALRIDWKR